LNGAFLTLEGNRAHALLLLGRTKDAEQIYLRYRGQKIEDGRDWTAVVLQDFEEFEKVGITTPEFTRIRKLLKTQTD